MLQCNTRTPKFRFDQQAEVHLPATHELCHEVALSPCSSSRCGVSWENYFPKAFAGEYRYKSQVQPEKLRHVASALQFGLICYVLILSWDEHASKTTVTLGSQNMSTAACPPPPRPHTLFIGEGAGGDVGCCMLVSLMRHIIIHQTLAHTPQEHSPAPL